MKQIPATLLTCCAVVFMGAACGAGPTTTARVEPAGPPHTETRRPEEQPAAPDPTGRRAPSWHVELVGLDLPDLEGPLVMASDLGNRTAHYVFVGPDQMSSLDIHGAAPDETGTFTPMSLQVSWAKEGIACGASSVNPGCDVQVEIAAEGDGIRATIDGTVSCGKIGGNGREPDRKATIHAWFKR